MLKEATGKQPGDAELWEMLGELLAPSDPAGEAFGGWGVGSGLGGLTAARGAGRHTVFHEYT